jgi:hypothetical protein
MTGEKRLLARLCAALIMVTLAVVLACDTRTADAADSQWRAKWVANPSGGTVESGQTFPVFFKARNIGTATWYQGTVRIATMNAQDQPSDSSVFANDSWLSPNRPATLTEDQVVSGAVGTFNFTMTAPQVSVSTVYRDYYGPVAELISWMYGCPDWCGAHIPVTVEPQRPPSVTIVQPPPERVNRGDQIDVTAEATDNVGVDHVVLSLDGAEQTVTNPPYTAHFSTDRLASGSHVITAQAVDHVGLSDQKVTAFSVDRPPPGHVTINESADFTNDPNVTLTVEAPPGTTGVRISNDPDFGTAPLQPVQQTYPWRLGDSPGERDTRIVFLRFVDPNEGDTVVFDNIILDQTRPRIIRARVFRRGNRKPAAAGVGSVTKHSCSRAPLNLSVKAHDDRSGVSGLRYGFSRRHLGTRLAFQSQLPVNVPPKLRSPTALFLRVRDGAGNLSKIRKVSLHNACR